MFHNFRNRHDHNTGDKFGQLVNIAKPKLSVAYHYFLDDDTIDPFFELYHQTCDIPIVLAQDLMVINITPEQIVTRQAWTNPLHCPPQRRLISAVIPNWFRAVKPRFHNGS